MNLHDYPGTLFALLTWGASADWVLDFRIDNHPGPPCDQMRISFRVGLDRTILPHRHGSMYFDCVGAEAMPLIRRLKCVWGDLDSIRDDLMRAIIGDVRL